MDDRAELRRLAQTCIDAPGERECIEAYRAFDDVCRASTVLALLDEIDGLRKIPDDMLAEYKATPHLAVVNAYKVLQEVARRMGEPGTSRDAEVNRAGFYGYEDCPLRSCPRPFLCSERGSCDRLAARMGGTQPEEPR